MTLIQLMSVVDYVGTDVNLNNEHGENIGMLTLLDIDKYKNKRVSMVGIEDGEMYIDIYID